MHYFSTFVKKLYMFRTNLLSIIRSLNTVFTAIGIWHASYVDCLLARSGWNSIMTSLADSWEIVHLVGFYHKNIRIYHDARSSERQMSNKIFVFATVSNYVPFIPNIATILHLH